MIKLLRPAFSLHWATDLIHYLGVSPLPSPMVPVHLNPKFPLGLKNPHFQHLVASGRLCLCDYVGSDGQLSPSAGISAADPPLGFRSAIQLHKFLRRCLQPAQGTGTQLSSGGASLSRPLNNLMTP